MNYWVQSHNPLQSSSNVRVDVWVVNQWWMIHIIFRDKFSIPKFAVLARSKQLYCEVSIRHFGCGLQRQLMRHLAKVGPMFPGNKCNKSIEKPRSNEEFRDSLPEAWGPWERQHAPHLVAECRMLQKDRVLVSKIWISGYWFWSGLSCIATASNPCRIVHIQLSACQLPMFSKCDSPRKRDFFDTFV